MTPWPRLSETLADRAGPDGRKGPLRAETVRLGTDGLRRCKLCGEIKSRAEGFYRSSGLVCRRCVGHRRDAWRRDHPDALREAWRRWNASRQADPERRQALNLWRRVWRAKHPEKTREYNCRYRAKKRGR